MTVLSESLVGPSRLNICRDTPRWLEADARPRHIMLHLILTINLGYPIYIETKLGKTYTTWSVVVRERQLMITLTDADQRAFPG